MATFESALYVTRAALSYTTAWDTIKKNSAGALTARPPTIDSIHIQIILKTLNGRFQLSRSIIRHLRDPSTFTAVISAISHPSMLARPCINATRASRL
jgi:hypothetical protein